MEDVIVSNLSLLTLAIVTSNTFQKLKSMMLNKYPAVLLLISFITLIGCTGIKKSTGTQQIYQLQGQAQGTTYSIRYISGDSTFTEGMANQLFAELDQSLSIYKPGSVINQFNESATGIQADEHLLKVVKKAMQVSNATKGAFDITVYPLVDAWGFANHKRGNTLPDSATIQQLLKCVGSRNLQISGHLLHKTNPCVKIDVNGIAQGYSVDYIAGRLDVLGIKNYMVEVGGEIKTRGTNSVNKRDWTIGIEQPGDDSFEPYSALLKVKGAAVTTSGSYRKFYDSEGKRITHLINPFTGYPIISDLVSVTVLAKDAITADGYDNALMFLGKEKALEFLQTHRELEAYLIYKKPDGTVGDTATTGFKKFIVPVNNDL